MDLKLYYKPECPFCVRVLDFMKENNIELEMKNIHDGTNKEDLIEKGGKDQVPCLFIDGKAMYESLEIIDFLKQTFNK